MAGDTAPNYGRHYSRRGGLILSVHSLMRIFGLLFVIAAQPLTVAAQFANQSCMQGTQRGSMEISVEARQSNAPSKPGLHWVVVAFPSEQQINVSDQGLKTAIKSWVDAQNSLTPSQKHDWLLDSKTSWNLFRSELNDSLKKALGGAFTITANPAAQPTAPAPVTQGTASFCFTTVAAPVVRNPDVTVSSPQYQVALTANPAALLAPIVLPAPGTGVTAHGLITNQDFSNDTEKTQLLNALGVVARIAWQTAQGGGLGVGIPAPDALVQTVQEKIDRIYSMKQGNLPASFWMVWNYGGTKIEFDQNTGNMFLRIRSVHMAKSARAQVDVEIKPASPNGNLRAQRLAGQSQVTINRRFAAGFAALTNSVPTFEQINSLRSDLALAPEISPPVTPAADPTDAQAIVFHANNRWIQFGFKLSLDAGYSPEDGVAGKANFAADNLLLKLRDNLPDKPRETESLTYSGGNEVQKLSALWAIDWTHPYVSQAQVNYGVHLSGDYSQDLDQRFGNLQGPPLRDRERGIKASIVYDFLSRPTDDQLNPVRSTYGINTTAGIEHRRVNITPASGNLVPSFASGSVTDAFLNLMFNYRYDSMKPSQGGIGGIDLMAAAKVMHGFAVSDFAFDQILASAQGTVYFGVHHPRDFFVRFQQGVGTSNGRTPLFELFRLGGGDTLRGIEQGEFVGRKLAYQQSETGISVRQIASWFASTSATGKTPKPSPIDLSKIYLKGFYDRGRVTNTGSFSDLIICKHAAKGYGFAVEVQSLAAGAKRITLSIGYARSPDSALHRSGLAITNVSLAF